MRPRISIRGSVRPSVRNAFSKMLENEKTGANLHEIRLKDASIGQILALFVKTRYHDANIQIRFPLIGFISSIFVSYSSVERK